MKAIQLKAPRQFERIETQSPDRPGPGEALVRTHVMGICGTDVSCYLGKFPFFDFPRIPGHELGIEVVDVGEGVESVQAGDRCSVEPYLNCGSCYACRLGNSNCCQNLKVIGVMMDGGLCDQLIIPAHKLHRSTLLDYRQLALVETLAIGCRAVNRANPQDGINMLIVGAGPIGLATLEFAKLTGAKISMADISATRLEFCEQNYSIENTFNFSNTEDSLDQCLQATDGDLFQVVVDATGNNRAMSEALQLVAPTGTLVYVGITTDEISFRHPSMHRKEMNILSSRNALPDDFVRIIELIENKTIDTVPWISHVTSFDNLIDDFPGLLDPQSNVIKAVIDVQ